MTEETGDYTDSIKAAFAELKQPQQENNNEEVQQTEDTNEESDNTEEEGLLDADSDDDGGEEEQPSPQQQSKPRPKGRRASAEFERAEALEAEVRELRALISQREAKDSVRDENYERTLKALGGNKQDDPDTALDNQLMAFNVPSDELDNMMPSEKKLLLQSIQTQQQLNQMRVTSRLSEIEQIVDYCSAQETRPDMQSFANGYDTYLRIKAHEIVTAGMATDHKQAAKIVANQLAGWVDKTVQDGKAQNSAEALGMLIMPMAKALTPAQKKEVKKAEVQIGAPVNLDKAKARAGTHGLDVQVTGSAKTNPAGVSTNYKSAMKDLYGIDL